MKKLSEGFGWCCFAVTLFFAVMAVLFYKTWPLDIVFNAPDSGIPSIVRWFSPTLLQNTIDGRFASHTLYWLLPECFAFEFTYIADTLLLILAGVYLLRGRKLSWDLSWLGGFSIGLSGYTFTLFSAGHRGYFHMFALGCFGFGLLLRCFRDRTLFHFVMLGAVIAWGLAVQPDIQLLLLMPLAAYALWLTFAPRARFASIGAGIFRVWPRFLVSIATLLILGWSILQQTASQSIDSRKEQIAQASQDGQISPEAQWSFATGWSLPLRDTAEFLVPGIFGDTSFVGEHPYWGELGKHGTPPYEIPNYRQHTVYLGIITVFLAAIAFLRKRPALKPDTARTEDANASPETAPLCSPDPAADTWFWGCVACVALILSFGSYTPVYRWFYAIPYMDLIRAPVKFLHFTEFALAMLMPIGLLQILEWPFKKRLVALLCLGFFLLLPCTVFLLDATPAQLEYARQNIIRSFVFAGLLGAVVLLHRGTEGHRTLQVALILVLLTIDMSLVASRYIQPIQLTPNAYARAITRVCPPEQARLMNLLPRGNEISTPILQANGIAVFRDNDYAPNLLAERGINFVALPTQYAQQFTQATQGAVILSNAQDVLLYIPANTKPADSPVRLGATILEHPFKILIPLTGTLLVLLWALFRGVYYGCLSRKAIGASNLRH